jgi:hypothetical protein
MQQNFEGALALLERLRPQWPHDPATASLIARVQAARETGLDSAEDQELLVLAGFSSGLSPFAEYILEQCELVGVDERSKARGVYDERDFSQVGEQLDKVRGRVPRQKADLCLTLAALCRKAPEAAGDRNLLAPLRRCFAFLGEAVISENLLHVDTARCYLAESLALARSAQQEEMPLAYIISTYLSNQPGFGELISPPGLMLVDPVLARFESDPVGWTRVEKGFAYFSALSVQATETLMQKLAKNRNLKNFLSSPEEVELARTLEHERVRAESGALGALSAEGQAISAGWLQDARAVFNSRAESTRFDLDRQRLQALASISGEAATYWLEKDYVEREARNGRLRNSLVQLDREIDESPTRLSVESLLPFCERLLPELETNFEQFKAAAVPFLTLDKALREDAWYIPADQGRITVKFELASEAGGPPVEGLDIVVQEENGLVVDGPCHSPEVLRGGERREIKLEVRPSSRQIADQVFTLRARLTYRTRSGEAVQSSDYTLPIPIGAAESFQPIPNPHMAYSGGKVVADPKTFFGRKDLMARVRQQVTEGPLGQCFVLYGQKRSGKTSVLRQLDDQIGPPNFTVPVTIGALDTGANEKNFVKMCLDAVREKLEDRYRLPVTGWPSPQDISDRPTESFRNGVRRALRTLREAGWEAPRMIFLVDEFCAAPLG